MIKAVAYRIAALSLGLFAPLPLAAQPSDSPLKLHQWVAPVFPPRLFAEGIVTGEVRVAIQVDTSGRLTDTLVVAYTDANLVAPTLDAIRKWTFDPAVVNGEARGTTTGLTFNFQPDSPVVVQGNFTLFQSDRNFGR